MFSDDDLRHVALWAAGCAERALFVFEAKAPGDTRSREAIAAIRAFALGGLRTAQLRKLAWAANAAAREAGDPAAAARAACTAAASAYTHRMASPHQVNHILSPAGYGAQAIALSAANEASGEAEIQWAISRASPAVRQVVSLMPGRAPGKSLLGKLFYQLDTGLRR